MKLNLPVKAPGSPDTARYEHARYERKFLVRDLDRRQVRALIRRHPALFHEPYPPRWVNNLYLDTEELDAYFDNVNGIEARTKVRIRWYGALTGFVAQPILEFKIKRGVVGVKESYPLAPFTLNRTFAHADLRDLLRRSALPPDVLDRLHGLGAVLCNRYYRWYFATHDRRFRVTLDTAMAFTEVRRLGVRLTHTVCDPREIIVELKYRRDLDRQAQRISRAFPFSLYRNSKYVNGIDRVYL